MTPCFLWPAQKAFRSVTPQLPVLLIPHPSNTMIPATRLPVIASQRQSLAALGSLLRLSLYLERISPRGCYLLCLGPRCHAQEGTM